MARIVSLVIGLALLGAAGIHAAESPAKQAGLDEFVKARSERRYANVPRKVLAFYYTWYGTPEGRGRWDHWEGVNAEKREIGSSTHYPALGAYDCYDTRVIETHIGQAKSHGVDGFICTWWRQNDIHDKALEKVLAIAAKKNFAVTVYWETTRSGRNDPVGQAASDVLYVLEKYGSHPAFLKLDGKPVIFVYGRVMGEVKANQWPEIIAAIEKKYGKDFLLIADGYSDRNARAFDGIHQYNPAGALKGKAADEVRAWARDLFPKVVQMAKDRGKIACVTVIPGYDDTKIRKPGLRVERHDGQTYGALWEEAIAAGPDWVLVTSWNEWHEGSEIEPSYEDSEKYLTLTGKCAGQFKAKR